MRRLSLILVLIFTVPLVHAAKPFNFDYEDEYTEEIVDCGDFSVFDDVIEVGSVRRFFDKDGNVIRSKIHAAIYDDMYRDDDFEGPHLTGTGHINGRWSFDENDGWFYSETGLGVSIVVPGEGHLFLDVGRLMWHASGGWELVFTAGNRHDWENGDFDALCEFFE